MTERKICRKFPGNPKGQAGHTSTPKKSSPSSKFVSKTTFMAFSSCSSSCRYDVFLSFRGEDTRDNILSHLVEALRQRKIKTFIDNEELSRGDEISPSLSKAIEESKISVIVFSKNYAASKWCLDELVKILECRAKNGQLVIPVFYDVDPFHVRKQEGSLKNAFVKYDKQFNRKMPEKVQKWRAVLTAASNLSGWDSKTTKPDAKLVKVITADILEKLEKISPAISDSDGLIGLMSRVEKVKSLLAIGLPDVQIVGIWGMGGIGKSTIAGEVFNQISNEFEGKYFMANVREESKKGGGLVYLRKQILSRIFGENFDIETPKLPQYTRDRLQRMKVLIVLDDVNTLGQLEYLAGGIDRFGLGSKIIVTTRDKTLLERYGRHEIYEVEGLNCNEALQLFCNCAFAGNQCPEDLLDPSKTAVRYAKGNPLALKVLGSFFQGKSKLDWANKLDYLKGISIQDMYDLLKISYDELSWKEKNLFLDIACFFNGDDRDHVTLILSDRYSVHEGLSVLVKKSLLTIVNDKLQMHDLLQDMGREIVCQESEEKPEKRSRLWYHGDVCHVLEKNKGTDAIEGIFLDLSKIEQIQLDPRVFVDMSNLRLLKFYLPRQFDVLNMISKVHLQQGLQYLPEELRYLYWHGYPLKTLPSDFVPQNLIEINLAYSEVMQIWEGKKKAPKLKYVDLNHSLNLTRIPEPLEIPNLERMNLWNCTRLAQIPLHIQMFNNLGKLGLVGCESLRCFPPNIHFISPIKIDFSYCGRLTEFPRISGNVVELKLWCTPIKEVPSSIECLTDLETLDLKFCRSLKRLSTSICKLKSLRSLYLLGCLNLESFPEILEKMDLLENINLCETGIKELPSSIEHLEGLKKLELWRCSKLTSLPESLGNLKSLEYLTAGKLAISKQPSSIANLNKLEELSLINFRGLVLPPRLSSLTSLETLYLRNCGIIEIPEGIGCLSSLKSLYLNGNNIESLPTSISQLSQLRRLYLRNCNMLRSLPKLPLRLEWLNAINCKRLQYLPEFPSCLQSLPEFPSCLEELDTSILETQSTDSLGLLKPRPVTLNFANCLKLTQANKSFWADLQQGIQQMAIASLKLEFLIPNGNIICLPGSEIPHWFSDQSLGSSITLQLPQRCCKEIFFGFALCAVIEFEEDSNPLSLVGCKAKWVDPFSGFDHFFELFYSSLPVPNPNSDHVILGLFPCWNIGLPDGDHHTVVSFHFFLKNKCLRGKQPKVKCCGVSPVYANPSQTNPGTFTLKHTATSEDFHDNVRKTGTTESICSFDEDEVESICREQFNAPHRQTSLFSQILKNLCCFDQEPWPKKFFEE